MSVYLSDLRLSLRLVQKAVHYLHHLQLNQRAGHITVHNSFLRDAKNHSDHLTLGRLKPWSPRQWLTEKISRKNFTEATVIRSELRHHSLAF